jgi:quercetin dioxygenase-like cupin family protein
MLFERILTEPRPSSSPAKDGFPGGAGRLRAAVETSRATGSIFERGDGGRFSGEVWLRTTLTDEEGTNVGIVHFFPGARTHWHRHPGGQFLYGVVGRGRVRTRGEPGPVLEPGDVIHAGTDEWHFHGGGPDTPLVHVAVNGGGTPEWAEPVTDEEYAEGF